MWNGEGCELWFMWILIRLDGLLGVWWGVCVRLRGDILMV